MAAYDAVMLVALASSPSGISPASRAMTTATMTVLATGIRRRALTRPKTGGTRPSRDIA